MFTLVNVNAKGNTGNNGIFNRKDTHTLTRTTVFEVLSDFQITGEHRFLPFLFKVRRFKRCRTARFC